MPTDFPFLDSMFARRAEWELLLRNHAEARGEARIRAARRYMAEWRAERAERAKKWAAIKAKAEAMANQREAA